MTDQSGEKMAIETKDLLKRFDNEIVINKLNLRIPFGTSMGIMGPSGTGKSVLLKCILGLTEYEGNIFYEGTLLEKQKSSILGDCRRHSNFGRMGQHTFNRTRGFFGIGSCIS